MTAGREILKMGPRFVVIKKGEHGALLVHKDGVAAFPAFPTEKVIDPTGAGDTFAGGMMGFLAGNAANAMGGSSNGIGAQDPGSYDSIRRSLAYGTIIASFTIEAFSLTRLENLKRPEIDARFREYAEMTRLH